MRITTLWLLGNICINSLADAVAVVQSGIISHVCLACTSDTVKGVRQEALYLLASLVSLFEQHDPHALKLFLSHFEVESIMLSVLKDFLSHPQIQILALSTFDKLLGSKHRITEGMTEGLRYQMNFEKQGGLDVLEEFSKEPNQQIYQMAYDIVEKYFSEKGHESATMEHYECKRGSRPDTFLI